MAPSPRNSGSRAKKAKHEDDVEVPKAAPALRPPEHHAPLVRYPTSIKATEEEAAFSETAAQAKRSSHPLVRFPTSIKAAPEAEPPASVGPAPPKRTEVHPDAEKWKTPASFDKWLDEEAKKARERLKAYNALAEAGGAEYRDEDPYLARRVFRWARVSSRYVEEVQKFAWVQARRIRAVKEAARRKQEEEERRAEKIALQEKADAERMPPADLRAVGLVAAFGGVMCAAGVPVGF